MADENNDGGGGAADDQGGGNQLPQRPEYVPEKFWDAEKGTIRAEDAFKSYGELEKKLTGGKGIDGLKADLKTELEAERLKGRPEKPEGYALQIGEGIVPEGVQWEFDEKDPMLAWWREDSFKRGRTQEEFQEGVNTYIAGQIGKLKADSDALVAEFEKLGEHGKARVDFLTGRISNIAGPSAVETLAPFLKTAASVEAMEKLIAAAGGPKFEIPPAGGGQLTEAQLKELQRSDKYLAGDPETVKKVQEGWQKLAPGEYQGGASRIA